MEQPAHPIGVLFVCLGNICRSPLAEGVFLHKAHARGVARRFRVESAGTGGWHEGELPDPRAREVAKHHGVGLPSRAKKVRPRDFHEFDFLIAMDASVAETLIGSGADPAKVRLFLELGGHATLREVPDPYDAGPEAFETVYGLIDATCDRLIDALLAVRT